MNLNNLATTYRTGGDLQRALAMSNEAIAIAEARGEKGWAGVPIGWCPVSERDKKIIKFERLRFNTTGNGRL